MGDFAGIAERSKNLCQKQNTNSKHEENTYASRSVVDHGKVLRKSESPQTFWERSTSRVAACCGLGGVSHQSFAMDAFGAEEPAQRAMQKGPKKFFKLTFIVYGDRDEIEPILGVASGLKKAGHDVLFITHHSMKGLVELWGLRFGPGNPYDPQQQYATEYSSMIMAGQSGDLCLSKIIHLNNNFKLIEEATLTCIKRMTDIIVCNVIIPDYQVVTKDDLNY